jgi:hypothetical protein
VDLAEILASGRLEIGEAQARMADLGHPAGRIDRARRALEVETIREGPPGTRQRFYWELPTSCPCCRRPYRPVAVHEPIPWRRNQADVGDYWTGEPYTIEPPSLDPVVPSTPPPTRRFEPVEPPRCTICGKAAAVDRGSPCPFWRTDGRRCAGVVE